VFILGLNIIRAYDVSVDLGCQTLRLAEEEVSLWSPGAGPRPSSVVVASDQVIPAQCKGVVVDRLETPLGVENGLVKPSWEAHAPKGLYITTTLVRDSREVTSRALTLPVATSSP
jgi:hypothetical protein